MRSRVPLPELEEWERARGLRWVCPHCGTGQPQLTSQGRCAGCGFGAPLVAVAVTAPYAKGSPTSKAAAKSIEHRMNSDAERVFEAIARAGARGRTTDELEVELGLTHQTCSARVNQLSGEGSIGHGSATRPTRSGRAANVHYRTVLERAK